jgi:hypothetical protein
MTKEITEKKKTNPLVYILGIPAGILILVLAIIQWQKYQVYKASVDYCKYELATLTNTNTKDIKEECLRIMGNQ